MKKLFSCLLVAASVLIIDSCQQPEVISSTDAASAARVSTDKVQPVIDLSVKGAYEVRDGIIYFKSVETFTSLDVALRKLTPENRVAFTAKLGFKSLLDIQLAIYKALSEADSQDKYANILDSNKDVCKVTGADNRTTSIFEEISADLLNREGMVSIGGRIHCFAKGKTIIASSIADVREAYKAGKKLKEGTVFIEDKTPAGGRRSFGPCSSMFRAAESSDGNRRVEIRVYIDRRVIDIGNNHCNIEFYTYTKGDPYKKNFWGSWTNYSTGNTLNARYDCSVKVWHPAGVSPAYSIYSATINNSHSNDGTFIDYYQTMANYYGYVLSDTMNGNGFSFEPSMNEYSSNPGNYTSGGVPNGVPITCF